MTHVSRTRSSRFWADAHETYVPESERDRGCGPRPSVKAIMDLVDTADPAWPGIAGTLRDFVAAGVPLTEDTVAAAVKLGQQRWAQAEEPRHGDSLHKTQAPGAIVYYIQRGLLIKIGTTANPHARFRALLPDEILAFEPGGRPVERRRHRQFDYLRLNVNREYFQSATELIEFARSLRAQHGDPDPSWPTTRSITSLPWQNYHGADGDLITAAQAGEELGLNPSTVRHWVYLRILEPAGKEGPRSLFRRGDLVRLRDNPKGARRRL